MVALSSSLAAGADPDNADGRKRNPKRPRPLLEHVQEDPQAAGDSKFARALGSVDAQTRNQGLTALAAWLSRRESVSEQEMTKIWKGLFYCFWHSDKQPVQKHLAERLAEIISSLQPEVAVMYFRVFLKTMQREWFGIDRLRLDKFMLLIRCFLSQAALCLCTLHWEVSAVEAQAACISEEVLGRGGSATNLAAGLGYHLADVFIAETGTACEQFGSASGACPSDAGLRAWLEPFCQTLAASDRAAFLPRLQDGVFGKLLQSVRAGDAWVQHLDVPALGAHLFGTGAQPGIKARNRAALYDISNQFKNASSKRQRISLPPNEAIKAAVSAIMGGKKKKKQKQHQGAVPNGTASCVQGASDSSPASVGAERLQRAASLEQEAAMATPGSDAEAVQEASAAGTALPGALHSLGHVPASPPASQQLPAANCPDSALRKKLRFSLQRNLYHASKGPVPPPEVRTPPNLQPKGPAIKKSATVGIASRKKSRLGKSAPATTAKKGPRQRKQLWT
ncbi:hypothetical protein WJX74_002347 [Apatococcus lobatus]|uniref:Uncharacterized protein n=1 Tax=Apatococcus lobatus TaxID=904363 RepID=A0AAW1QVJ4_9CHLO